jgi:hypothetical protein
MWVFTQAFFTLNSASSGLPKIVINMSCGTSLPRA